MADKPTHEQGQLQLQFYDLRREAKLREARDWFTQYYFVDSFEDSQRVAPFGSKEGTYLMMVLSYWDQACAYLNHGLLHEQLFFAGEGGNIVNIASRLSFKGEIFWPQHTG